MDSYLNLVSLALAIAALVPVLMPGGRARFWTISAAAVSLVGLLAAYQLYKTYSEQRAVEAVKGEIVSLLAKNKSGLTFVQIYDGLYYRDYETVESAVDSMVDQGRVFNNKKETRDAQGNKYVVRVYFSHKDN